ncbi:unnamed protein product [Litomosoides sigmodontis]|uniref:Nucleoporin NUP35 n=1 Tax=Litomosoides sigmodontis TaxID=42156 RepID=A0A3P6V5X3_LITSI|nr:unnamed protein product [Litomosoides sigmodontis]
MQSKSEASVFSDARLPSGNTGSFTGQTVTPSFLFGPRSKRRNLIMSFDSSAAGNQISEQDIRTASSKNSSQSGKSVHWSPTLTQTRSIASSSIRGDFAMDTTDHDELSSSESHTVVDPPLRSMREELLSPHQISKDSNSTIAGASVSRDMLDLQTEKEVAEHWVTVFGFTREDIPFILKLFARHGAIVAHRFPKEGNWMFLRYASSIHAQQALSRNGQIIDGRLRLGVVSVDSEELVKLKDDEYFNSVPQANNGNNVQFNHNKSTLSEHSFVGGDGPLTLSNSVSHSLDAAFSSSLIASPVRPGIRSLRASFNAVDSYYQADEERESSKPHGLLDKLWSFVSILMAIKCTIQSEIAGVVVCGVGSGSGGRGACLWLFLETFDMSIPEGDYERGKKLFKMRCLQCHVIDSDVNKNGPTLKGVIGRKSGTVDGYPYSTANKNKGVVWTRETLFEYLLDPKKYIPGTKMVFAGLKKPQERADLIKFIEEESKK